MNELEKALLDESGVAVDFYLEGAGTMQIIKDINEIKDKATISTPAGILKAKLLAVLMEH